MQEGLFTMVRFSSSGARGDSVPLIVKNFVPSNQDKNQWLPAPNRNFICSVAANGSRQEHVIRFHVAIKMSSWNEVFGNTLQADYETVSNRTQTKPKTEQGIVPYSLDYPLLSLNESPTRKFTQNSYNK